MSASESDYSDNEDRVDRDAENDALSVDEEDDKSIINDAESVKGDEESEDDPDPTLGILDPVHGYIRDGFTPSGLIKKEFDNKDVVDVIGVVENEDFTFFYVLHDGKFENGRSVFFRLKEHFKRYIIVCQSLDDDNNPVTDQRFYIELYVPQYLMVSNAQKKEREDYIQSGVDELKKLLAGVDEDNDNAHVVEDGGNNDVEKETDKKTKPGATDDETTVTLAQGKLQVKVGPSEEEKRKKKTKDIQAKHFSFLDKNIPRRMKHSGVVPSISPRHAGAHG